MNRAYLFPGQGFQYVGMGKSVYESSPLARDYFEAANEMLGYRITDFMFHYIVRYKMDERHQTEME